MEPESPIEVEESGKKKRSFEVVMNGRPASRSRWPLFAVLGCILSCCLCCVLPICALVVTGVGFAAILEGNKVSASGTEHVSIDPAQPARLEVTSSVGSIVIKPGNSDEVVVEYTKTAYGLNTSMARKELDRITVDVEQRDDGTVVVTVNQKDTKDSWSGRINDVDLTIQVPPEVDLTLSNQVGDIRVTGVRASSLDIQTSTGAVDFDASLAESGNFNIKANVGGIHIRLPQSAFVKVDAKADVGDFSISGFDVTDRESDQSGPSATWSGILGSGEGTPPTLTLRIDVGDIRIESGD